jgi:Zn-dependent peptidase ImmA (M78 family)
MSERITADNLDEVVRENIEIHDDMLQKTILVRTNWNSMQIGSSVQLAMHILRMYGLVQLPLDNQNWSGAIYVKSDKKIPVINTAQPRANQYFTAWCEIYHLIYDQVLLGRIMETETVIEDRKAQYFAALMLMGNLMPYYTMLSNMDFTTKVFHCMDTFSVPYKAVLISLYEAAMLNGNSELMGRIRQNFDVHFYNLDARFRANGLDDQLVKPSNIVNVTALQSKIQDRIKREPDVGYNKDNLAALENIVKEIDLTVEQ